MFFTRLPISQLLCETTTSTTSESSEATQSFGSVSPNSGLESSGILFVSPVKMSLSFALNTCSGETGVITDVFRIISTKKLPDRFLKPASATVFPIIEEPASISVSTKYSRQPSLNSSIASLCAGRILSANSAR